MTPEDMLTKAEILKQNDAWDRADAMTVAAILRQGQLDLEAKLDRLLEDRAQAVSSAAQAARVQAHRHHEMLARNCAEANEGKPSPCED